MPFASVNGQQLYFEDTGGGGPVVVFSHGNLMNRDMWAPQVEALCSEFRCVTWDERLHGRTKDDGGLYTYWDSAAICSACLTISVPDRLLWPVTPRAASCRYARPCSRPNGSRPWS
jgi:pimeloyl-ACP methyl ester carboxylesterase